MTTKDRFHYMLFLITDNTYLEKKNCQLEDLPHYSLFLCYTCSCSFPLGAIIGIAVGGGVLALLLIALCVCALCCLVCRWRKKKVGGLDVIVLPSLLPPSSLPPSSISPCFPLSILTKIMVLVTYNSGWAAYRKIGIIGTDFLN